MMRPSVRRLMFAAALAACVPAVPAWSAQETQQDAPQMQALDTVAQDIPDQKLDAAASAMRQVASLKESYQKKLEAAPQSDKERIAEEASSAMTKVVTDKGLSVDEYAAILEVAQTNPAVRQKIIDRIRTPEKK